MKNNKVISKIATMVIVMAVLALVVAKLYDIATHRPSLAYRQLSPQTVQLEQQGGYRPESQDG